MTLTPSIAEIQTAPLASLLPPRPDGGAPWLSEIKKAVAAHFDVTVIGLEGPCRDRRLARPRQVVMWIARKLTRHSTTIIGRNLGGRDHSTIVTGAQQIDRLLASDTGLWDDVRAILEKLEAK